MSEFEPKEVKIEKYKFELEQLYNDLSEQIDYYENKLYADITKLQKGNMHERELSSELENEYWSAKDSGVVAQLQEKSEVVLEAIASLEEGRLEEQNILELLGQAEKGEAKAISSRKLKAKELKEKYGYDALLIERAGYNLGYFKSDPRRITKGGSKTKIITDGILNASNAEAIFNSETARTHGGQSRKSPGKKGKTYVSSKGNVIRKS